MSFLPLSFDLLNYCRREEIMGIEMEEDAGEEGDSSEEREEAVMASEGVMASGEVMVPGEARASAEARIVKVDQDQMFSEKNKEIIIAGMMI